MPEGDPPLVPPEVPIKIGTFRKSYIKSEPLFVGAAWFLIVQGVRLGLSADGYHLDPGPWRVAGLGLGALAFVISRSHVSTLAFRLTGIRFLNFVGLISKTDYPRIRAIVLKAFTERILKD
jgi:hypothetical protein